MTPCKLHSLCIFIPGRYKCSTWIHVVNLLSAVHVTGDDYVAVCSLLTSCKIYRGNPPWICFVYLLQAKAAIRQILPLGLKESISKVRSSVAYAVSAIAHWDWPEAWPELFQILMEALTSGNQDAVHGAMRVLTGKLLSDDNINNNNQICKISFIRYYTMKSLLLLLVNVCMVGGCITQRHWEQNQHIWICVFTCHSFSWWRVHIANPFLQSFVVK